MNADQTFALLEECAAAGERCPMAHPHGPLPSWATSQLAKDGKIAIELYTKNYRVVTILVGPHAGKSTKGAPTRKAPYRTVGQSRPGPSVPRRIV